MPDAQVLADLDKCRQLGRTPRGDAHRLLIPASAGVDALPGFMPPPIPAAKAAVARYGKLVGQKTPDSAKYPVDIAVDLNAPVLGLYGGKDASIPRDTVETMRHALRAASAKAEIIVCPEADHAFNADYRASYREESAKDGWQRMLAWFYRSMAGNARKAAIGCRYGG